MAGPYWSVWEISSALVIGRESEAIVDPAYAK